MLGDHANVAWDIRRLGEVTSTNTVALGLARSGQPEGVVVVADHQTAGRGRLGRIWQAPPGSSLLVSILLRPGPALAAHQSHLLTAAVALAASDACQTVAGVQPALKWPNDLVVAGPQGLRKLAGVLAESDLMSGQLAAVVVGIGVNVNWPDHLPDELSSVATSLNHLTGGMVDREALLAAVLDGLARRYRRLAQSGGAADLVGEFRRRCITLGTAVSVDLGTEQLQGLASDISPDGQLGVDVEGGIRWVAAGDVTHLRPA